jgi:hypothetical protein
MEPRNRRNATGRWSILAFSWRFQFRLMDGVKDHSLLSFGGQGIHEIWLEYHHIILNENLGDWQVKMVIWWSCFFGFLAAGVRWSTSIKFFQKISGIVMKLWLQSTNRGNMLLFGETQLLMSMKLVGSSNLFLSCSVFQHLGCMKPLVIYPLKCEFEMPIDIANYFDWTGNETGWINEIVFGWLFEVFMNHLEYNRLASLE